MNVVALSIDALPDPITMEVVRHKLEGIANEMQMTLLRSSFSSVVKEGLDCSASLFTIEGETLAQACAIPIHLSALIPIIKTLLKTYPLEVMHEGDVYILNDPYLGGTHLPDIAIMVPIFFEGTPIALATTLTHHQDVGGITPGSLPPNATDIFQEGLRIPPLRLVERGVENTALLALLRQNVRVPDSFIGDLNGQIAACKVGTKRLAEAATSLGRERLMFVFSELLRKSELMTREALREYPSGTYLYSDYLDNDGIDLDKRILVSVAVTLNDGTMHVDFSDTDPQVLGPANSTLSGAYAGAHFAVRVLTGSEIPTNGGCFRPVTVYAPPGSLLNPIEPAPVNMRSATVQHVSSCILGALAGLAPNRISSQSSGPSHTIVFGGKRPTGGRFVTGEFLSGGSGASVANDGVDVIETETTNGMNLPVESLEMEAPVRVHRFGLRADSGGLGKFRGGLGMIREYESLIDGMSFTHRGSRHFSPASGMNGGLAGEPAHAVIIRANGREEIIKSKIVTVLNRGDRVIVGTAGGGGYGEPNLRELEKLQQDILNHKVNNNSQIE